MCKTAAICCRNFGVSACREWPGKLENGGKTQVLGLRTVESAYLIYFDKNEDKYYEVITW